MHCQPSYLLTTLTPCAKKHTFSTDDMLKEVRDLAVFETAKELAINYDSQFVSY